MQAPEPIAELKVERLRKRIGSFELQADFRVAPGERVALVGKSGCGKTSLLRLIAGLEPVDSGRILLGSRDISRDPPQLRGIGFVFQDQSLFPGLDLIDNATFAWKARGMKRAEREKLASSWLERAGLSSLIGTEVARLSGGEAQRVAFLRALIWRPRLILLDEPFTALDREARQSLQQALRDLHDQWPAPLIVVSHDTEDLWAVATARLEFDAAAAVRSVIR